MPPFAFEELLCIKPEELSYFKAESKSIQYHNEVVNKAMLLFFGEQKRMEFPKTWISAVDWKSNMQIPKERNLYGK
jgi:hypothetical protein